MNFRRTVVSAPQISEGLLSRCREAVFSQDNQMNMSGIDLSSADVVKELCSIIQSGKENLIHQNCEKNVFEFILCKLGDENLRSLLESIKFGRHRRSIRLGWNEITPVGVSALEYFFSPHISSPDHSSELFVPIDDVLVIDILDMEGNYLGDKGCAALSVLIPQGAQFGVLNLQSNGISIAGISALQKMFQRGVTVSTLNLQSNCIGRVGVEILFDSIEYTGGFLTELNISGNKIGKEGSVFIAQILNSCSSLTSLDISNNLIEDRGALIIAEALRDNKALSCIDISNNDISSIGAEDIANHLTINGALTSLKLTRTISTQKSIGERGGMAIARLLAVNATLTSIDLYGGLIGRLGAEEIASGLRQNSTLRFINLGGNFIGPQAVRFIRDALDDPDYLLTTNSQYMKVRAPSEPMKFYRKRIPSVIPIKVADRIITDNCGNGDNYNPTNGGHPVTAAAITSVLIDNIHSTSSALNSQNSII